MRAGDNLILQLIERAVLAGAYRAAAREHTGSAARGFMKLAAQRSKETAELAAQVRDGGPACS